MLSLNRTARIVRPGAVLFLGAVLASAIGCSPADYRQRADEAAGGYIGAAQQEAFGQTRPFDVEPPADRLRKRLLIGQELPVSAAGSLGADALAPIERWPEEPGTPEQIAPVTGPVRLSLAEALQVAARNSRDYQTRKENVFRAALNVDLEADAFRNTFFGTIDGLYSADLGPDQDLRGITNTNTGQWSKRLKTGAELSGRIFVDLVKLLTLDRASSMGLLADATITVPLLRGAGRHIVTEPLTQARRDLVYEMLRLERFKRTLAVDVASGYLAVLRQLDQVRNAEENYRQLIASTRRARALADAGRLSEIQVGQARQDELRARDRWISAQQTYLRQLDSFKITLGLPTDAEMELDRGELEHLAELAKDAVPAPGSDEAETGADEPPASAGPTLTTVPSAADPNALEQIELPPVVYGVGRFELPPVRAVEIALVHRLDLHVAAGEIYDAQRKVVVAADALQAGLTLTGTALAGERRSLGSAGLDDAQLRPEFGTYTAGLLLDLPLERTAEQDAYRDTYIALERSVRSLQELEDQVKLEIRNSLRTLVRTREGIRIQAQAVQLARRRVRSTELFLEAGRAEIRDLLEAQESLISAQNALTAALVEQRVAELELQRDMGVLEVTEEGLWREYDPRQNNDEIE